MTKQAAPSHPWDNTEPPADLPERFGGGTTLPFNAPLFYVINGKAAAKGSPMPAMYFGGWSVDQDAMKETIARERRTMLSYLKPGELAREDGSGKILEVFTSRALVIAPVAYRQCWLMPDKTRSPHFVKGGRQSLNVLVELADMAKGVITPWGPAILSSKGYQAKYLMDAIASWEGHTSSIRAQECPGFSASSFWSIVGTFGDTPQTEMVGSVKKSPVTPISAQLPEATVALLTARYVGEPILKQMVEHKKQAAEWLASWSQNVETQAALPLEEQPADFGAQPPEEEIPF